MTENSSSKALIIEATPGSISSQRKSISVTKRITTESQISKFKTFEMFLFSDLLSGAHINYWHCVEIVDTLKETEKDTKNFFGQYGSQRMALWKEVVALYERDNIYLGEAAQLLSQAVSYDLPGEILTTLSFSSVVAFTSHWTDLMDHSIFNGGRELNEMKKPR